MPYDITHDELTHMAKRNIRVMKFSKSFYKNQESGKGKKPNEQSSNMKGKCSSKGNKVECFNYQGVGHYSQDCPNPKISKFLCIQILNRVFSQLLKMRGTILMTC